MASLVKLESSQPQGNALAEIERKEVADNKAASPNETLFYPTEGLWEDFNIYATSDFRPHFIASRVLMLQGQYRSLHGRVHILGPGRVEPLGQICNTFAEVILTDYTPTLFDLFKKHHPKVKTQQQDLTNGYYARATALLETFESFALNYHDDEEGKKTFKACFKALIGFLTNYKVDKPAVKADEQSDYVISSLVSSQLDLTILTGFEKLFKKHFRYILEDNVKYKKAEKTFKTRLQVEHIDYLQALVKPGGIVLFADTVDLLQNYGSSRKKVIATQMVCDAALGRLSENFKVQTFRSWDWVVNSKDHEAYTVQGYLLKKSQ